MVTSLAREVVQRQDDDEERRPGYRKAHTLVPDYDRGSLLCRQFPCIGQGGSWSVAALSDSSARNDRSGSCHSEGSSV